MQYFRQRDNFGTFNRKRVQNALFDELQSERLRTRKTPLTFAGS